MNQEKPYVWMLSSENLQESRKPSEMPPLSVTSQYSSPTAYVSQQTSNLPASTTFPSSAVMVPNAGQVPSASIPMTLQSNSVDPSMTDGEPLVMPMAVTTTLSSDQQTQESTNISSSVVPISTEQLSEESTLEEPTLRHFYVINDTTPELENPNLFVDPETGERWIRCQNPFCGKWRFVPPEVPIPEGLWFCVMNTWDESIATCEYPQLEEGCIITKKEEPEKPWLPHVESHFEQILPNVY